MSTTENRNKNAKVRKSTIIMGAAIVVLLAIVVGGVFLIFGGSNTQKIAYSDKGVQLYAGPGEEYAIEETVTGFFELQNTSNSWAEVLRHNDDGDTVLRWVKVESLDSWGTYFYHKNELPNPMDKYYLSVGK